MILAVDTIYSVYKPNNPILNLEIIGAFASLSMKENNFQIHFSEKGAEIKLAHYMDIDDIDKLIHYLTKAKEKLIANKPEEL